MNKALALSLKLAEDIKNFPLGQCGPSDDPDIQYIYVAEFREIVKRFVGAVNRIGDTSLSCMVINLDTSPELISEAHILWAELIVVIDALEDATQDPNYKTNTVNNTTFLDTDILIALKDIKNTNLDLTKLIKMCEELNDAYSRGNYISSCLLMRAIMNHIPSVFNAKTFSEVVSQSGRSIKAILSPLNEEARPIADFHTHILMRQKELLPTKNQIEPYKVSFEILINEVITKLNN